MSEKTRLISDVELTPETTIGELFPGMNPLGIIAMGTESENHMRIGVIGSHLGSFRKYFDKGASAFISVMPLTKTQTVQKGEFNAEAQMPILNSVIKDLEDRTQGKD